MVYIQWYIYKIYTRLCIYEKLNIITATKIIKFKIVGIFRKKTGNILFPNKNVV